MMETCRTKPDLNPRASATTEIREILSRLAPCLEYPTGRLLESTQQSVSLLAGTEPAAGEWLKRFLESIRDQPVERLEELYTRTFLVTPQCIPYLSVHLFGEESFKRAELMAGLLETYRRKGFETNSELPDHLALVLRFAPHFSLEEWRDLRRYCLNQPLAKMIESLAGISHADSSRGAGSTALTRRTTEVSAAVLKYGEDGRPSATRSGRMIPATQQNRCEKCQQERPENPYLHVLRAVQVLLEEMPEVETDA